VPIATNLFQYEPLSKYLSDRRDAARRAVSDIRSLEDLSAKELELRKMYRVAFPTLMRSHAKFEINETSAGIAATVTVPCQGDLRLLEVKPDNAGHRHAGLRATVDDGRRWGSEGPKITLAKTFTTATSTDEVKTWAKTEVDTIEAWLSDMTPQVNVYNRTFDEFMDDVIESRRAVLASAENLRAELEDGI
jgi:hypothetical protein